MNVGAVEHDGFRLGEIQVDPQSGEFSGPAGRAQVDPKVMEVLLLLARHAGKVVSREELLETVWPGVVVTDHALSRCIYQLREHLQTAGGRPYRNVLETLPKRGYRLNCPPAPGGAGAEGGLQARTSGEAPPAAEVTRPAREVGRGWRWRPVALPIALVAAFLLSVPYWGVGSRGGETPRTAVAPGLSIPPHSIAVLPFADLSADGDKRYFSDGVTEEILNRLAARPELHVIARTSSFAFRDSSYDVPRISSLLGVNYLLEGSIRTDDKALRVTAQLVDRSGRQMWSEKYDRDDLGAIFAIQDDIAEAVAARIVPQIAPPAARKREPDFEAYREFLIGREGLVRRTAEFYQGDTARFDRAIELDPEFAEAYAARAVSLLLVSSWADDHSRQLARARQDIDRALELDPGLAVAYAALGLLEQNSRSADLAKGERMLRRAIELDPGLVDAYNWLSGTLESQGRLQESDEQLLRAVQIDPLAPIINANLAMRELDGGQPEAAERRLLRLLDVPQPSVNVYTTLAELYVQTGRVAEAVATAKLLALSSVRQAGRLDYADFLAYVYAQLGLMEEATEWFGRQQAWPGQPALALWQPVTLGLLGHRPPAAAVADFEAVLQAAGMQPESLYGGHAGAFGMLLLLAGEFDRAIVVLEPVVAADHMGWFNDARLALAWARLERGESATAFALLEPAVVQCQKMESQRRLHRGDYMVRCAVTALLAGHRELALQRLTRAVDSGWAGYYRARTLPWFRELDAEPAFQVLMARLEAGIAKQRALVEAADRSDEFEIRLAAALTAAGQNNQPR